MVLTTMSPIAKATEGAKPITVCSEIQGMRGTLQPKEENLSTLGICFLTFVDIFVGLDCGRILDRTNLRPGPMISKEREKAVLNMPC